MISDADITTLITEWENGNLTTDDNTATDNQVRISDASITTPVPFREVADDSGLPTQQESPTTESTLEGEAILSRHREEEGPHPNMDSEYPTILAEANTTPPQEEEEEKLVPPNEVISSQIERAQVRYKGAPWFEEIPKLEVTLAGLGGIGSWTALLLGRVRPKYINLYDDDIIETENLAGQLYTRHNAGRRKSTISCHNLLGEYSSYFNYREFGRYEQSSISSPIMICGFDNMPARKIYYNKWKARVLSVDRSLRNNYLFIDGRMAAETFQIFAITGDNEYEMNIYEEKWLFSDEEADPLPCSYKQTSFCASMIASLIINLLVNFAANLKNPVIPRDLPFYTEYNAEQMFLKTE